MCYFEAYTHTYICPLTSSFSLYQVGVYFRVKMVGTVRLPVVAHAPPDMLAGSANVVSICDYSTYSVCCYNRALYEIRNVRNYLIQNRV